MNRRTRTLIVLAVAISLASVAAFGVYRAIRNIPVRYVAIATKYAVVAKQTVLGGAHCVRTIITRVTKPAAHSSMIMSTPSVISSPSVALQLDQSPASSSRSFIASPISSPASLAVCSTV